MAFFTVLRYAYYIFFILFVLALFSFFHQFKTWEDPSDKKIDEIEKRVSYIAERCGYKEEENSNDNI